MYQSTEEMGQSDQANKSAAHWEVLKIQGMIRGLIEETQNAKVCEFQHSPDNTGNTTDLVMLQNTNNCLF